MWLNRLDESLANRSKFEAVKIHRIDSIHDRLQRAQTLSDRYNSTKAMYEEYRLYSYDSALVYALRCQDLAVEMAKPESVQESQCAVAFCLISGGLLSEASDYIGKIIPPSSAVPELQLQYYDLYSSLYRSMADYAHDDPFYTKYITLSNAYLDSMMSVVPPNSAKWLTCRGSHLMRELKHAEALDLFRNVLNSSELDEHEKAQVAAEMAWAYVHMGDEEKAMEFFAKSAIFDNETSTREITALYHLARLLYRQGYYERASDYVHQALEDVQFYNSRLRKVEIGDILPIIEQDRYNAVQNQRNWLIAASVLLVILIVVVLHVNQLIHKKNRMLADARDTIAEQLEQLRKGNEMLKEADEIKNAFIGRSFYTNVEFIEKLEKIFIAIDRKITARQYNDLHSMLQLSRVNNEREDMYEAFDQTFLKLFPDFVQRYNDLFEEKDRKQPPTDDSLTSEMRIFALIRLGITDSERIAKFLNYSVHTVNTYKTRIKNRSTAENDRFEQLIMQI